MNDSYHAFISYSRLDLKAAAFIKKQLSRNENGRVPKNWNRGSGLKKQPSAVA